MKSYRIMEKECGCSFGAESVKLSAWMYYSTHIYTPENFEIHMGTHNTFLRLTLIHTAILKNLLA